MLSFRIVFLSFFAISFAVTLQAKTIWKLKSGESFCGEQIERTNSTVTISLSYGKLELNLSEIESETNLEEKVSSVAVSKKEPLKNQTKKPTFKTNTITDMSRSLLPNRPYSDIEHPTTLDWVGEDYFKNIEWTTAYKDFIQNYIPEGLLMRFRIAYSDVVTNADKSSLNMAMTLQKSWYDVNYVFFYGFYNYENQYYNQTNSTFISTNKYGAGGEYSYNFLGKNCGLFTTYAVDYKTDYIKFIDVMVDNMVGIGYEFKFLQQYGIDFDIAIGPGARYSQYSASKNNVPIEGNDTYFMGYMRQNLIWHITKQIKIEQRLIYGLDLEHLQDFSNEYYEQSIYFSVGVVYSPTDVFSLTFRYQYDYDAENNLAKNLNNSYSSDTRLIFGVEIPIGWKK